MHFETMSKQKPVVDFLIAGVQKSGTTALAEFLRQHQQICMSKRKELHYFNSEAEVKWKYKDHSNYEANFAHKQEGQLAGEATPIYTYWPNCLERIKDYNPDMKLIITLRDPVDRAYSHWRMAVSNGFENLSFSKAIRDGRKRVANSQNADQQRLSYVERGFYLDQVKRAQRLFPYSNVLFLSYEFLRNDRDAYLDMICSFLDIEKFHEYPLNQVVQPTPVDPNVSPLSDDDRTFLKNIFWENVRETEKLLNIEICTWST